MKIRLKRKISILIVFSMVLGGIYTGQTQTKIRAQETEDATTQVVNIEEEATINLSKNIKAKMTTNEIVSNVQSTKSAEETETVTEEPISEEESTSAEPTSEEPTSVEPTSEKPTTAKKIKWNGKVVPGATMKGIDVSHHNGTINWKKVAASDIDYAIIRCGYGSDYKSQDDRQWENNVAGCEKYNIPYGVYIYSYAMTPKQARSEAAHVLRLVQGHQLSFPIYFDMEEHVQEQLPMVKRQKIIETFLNVIESNGYECGVYANLNWWTNYIYTLADKVFYKWVAQYNTKCAYTGVYQMWQCSSTAKVSGISGNVDLNFWYDEVRDASYNIYHKVTITRPKRVTIKKVTAGKKKATIKWKRQSKAIGYKVQCATSKKFKKVTSKNTSKTSLTIKKLKSKKKYYFRVKAYKYKNGKKLYSKEWSKIISKKIK